MPGLSSLSESFLGLGLGDLCAEKKLSGWSVIGLRPSLMIGILLGDRLSFILGILGPSSCLSLILLRSAIKLGLGEREPPDSRSSCSGVLGEYFSSRRASSNPAKK